MLSDKGKAGGAGLESCVNLKFFEKFYSAVFLYENIGC